jgi:stress response protein YsnF/sporulation protein YlmC with PRC-barrel domain
MIFTAEGAGAESPAQEGGGTVGLSWAGGPCHRKSRSRLARSSSSLPRGAGATTSAMNHPPEKEADMAQLSPDDVQNVMDRDLYDSNGERVGPVADIYLDKDTRQPEWALVKTGMFGTKASFVPLEGASAADGDLRVGFSKDQIKDAPRAEADGELSQEEEAELYRHYGLSYSEAPSDTGLPADTGTSAGTGVVDGAGARDTSGPNTDTAVTRSEERLNLSTVRRPSELVRLRKTIETENVSTTVPVEREVLRVERSPSPTATSVRPCRAPTSPPKRWS